MQMKGYTYRDETARQVGLEAMQNGITGGGNGGGAAGGIGDVASLGVTLGAMGGVINMTKDAMAPIMGESQKVGEGFGNVVNGNTGAAPAQAPQATQAAAEGAWNCPNCGKAGITSRFCPDCGLARPV